LAVAWSIDEPRVFIGVFFAAQSLRDLPSGNLSMLYETDRDFASAREEAAVPSATGETSDEYPPRHDRDHRGGRSALARPADAIKSTYDCWLNAPNGYPVTDLVLYAGDAGQDDAFLSPVELQHSGVFQLTHTLTL
jgi:hypothetical protein